jgi:hypothetical protein
MTRMNDVGGLEGFGAVDTFDDLEPFHADWEARVYALNVTLLRKGVYELDEFRDAVERLEPATYLGSTYFERWLAGIETLLREKGVL